MKRLSIILPVYNVEAYIEKCIRSLEEQDIQTSEYEVIVVNDGTPDRSRDIVETLMREFRNIILVNQDNQGVSAARNSGIRAASGRFILFVDPDDYLDNNCLRQVLSACDRINGCELLMFNLKEVELNGAVTFVNNSLDTNLNTNGIDLYHSYRRVRGETGVDSSLTILINREFLIANDIYYLQNVPYLEDGEFIARLFCKATKCGFLNAPFYNRTIRQGSATHSNLFFSERAMNGFMKAGCALKEFQTQAGLSQQQIIFLNQPICKFVLLVLFPSCSFSKISQFKSWVSRLKAAGFSKCNLQGCNRYYKIEGRLYNLSPYLLFLHRLLGAPLLKVISPY
jgi:glycosyltransferase involved in cell wall biosynthesis